MGHGTTAIGWRCPQCSGSAPLADGESSLRGCDACGAFMQRISTISQPGEQPTESLAQQISRRLRIEIDEQARDLADELRASYGPFAHVLEVDDHAPPTTTVTATRLADGSVRLATSCDAIRIESLDDAIEALCMERFRADPEGYERFICELLPRVTLHDGPYVFRDIGEKHSGSISATGRTTVLDEET